MAFLSKLIALFLIAEAVVGASSFSREIVPEFSIGSVGSVSSGSDRVCDKPAQPSSLELTVFQPLVSHSEQGFVVNPVFSQNIETIIHFIELSYVVVRSFNLSQVVPERDEHPLFLPFFDRGWLIRPFIGKTGEKFDDVPGIVGFNRSLDMMIISLHGSSTHGDWITNLDTAKVDDRTHHLGISGVLHRGFSIKASQFRYPLLTEVQMILDTLSFDEINRLQVFVTGHSQGAALAHLAGAMLVRLFMDQLGSDFDNVKMNKIQLYRLSAPRTAGDSIAHSFLDQLIGKHNDIRHNVYFDPIPSLLPGKMIHQFLGWFRADCANDKDHYRSSGTLALQYAFPTVSLNLKRNPFSFLSPSWQKLRNVLIDVVAPFHLGSSKKRELGGSFDPELVDLDTVRVLNQGRKHQEDQKNKYWFTRIFGL